MKNQLIQLYVWVWAIYDKHPVLNLQRMSNSHQPLSLTIITATNFIS